MSKVVFVTGSSQGIGKEIALSYAKAGYSVAINCVHSTDKLEEALCEIKQYNNKVIALQGDISDYSIAEKIYNEIKKQLGTIDILVNNAGISYIGLFNEIEPNQWQHIMNNNINSAINCSHLAIQDMIHHKKGNIINISSMWGNLGASCEVIYSASKGALNSFTKSLAKELAPCNIRVNAISCGAIETRTFNAFW